MTKPVINIFDAIPSERTYILESEMITILKRLRRRMQMKSVRYIQMINKIKNTELGKLRGAKIGGSGLVIRAAMWESACALIDEEIECLEKKRDTNKHIS